MSFPAICFSYFDSSEIFKVLFKNWPKIIEIFIFIITKKNLQKRPVSRCIPPSDPAKIYEKFHQEFLLVVYRYNFPTVSLGVFAEVHPEIFTRTVSSISLTFLYGISPVAPPGISLTGFHSSSLNFLSIFSRDYSQNYFPRYLSFSKDFFQKSGEIQRKTSDYM